MAKMQAIFGGKNPHPQSIVVGGVTCVQDIQNPARLALFKQLLLDARKFVKQAYLPDIYMAGTMYAGEATDSKATFSELMGGKGVGGTGGGLLNFMSYGGFRLDDTGFYKSALLFPSGVVLGGDISKVVPLDQEKIAEDVTHSWYKGSKPLHPYEGQTIPEYTGLDRRDDGMAYLKTKEKYSWIKSPLYNDTRVEVGPLARMVIGVAAKDKRITKYVTEFLERGKLPIAVLFSTVGRTAARAIETNLMSDVMVEWIDELTANVLAGDKSTWTDFDFDKVSVNAKGRGMEEAPRGSLGHWVRIENGKVANYQAIVPSTWNAAPRDHKNRLGAYEASLIGTKVANPEQPLEIIRTIHSFDPCIACAVHVVDTKGKELAVYKVDTSCSI
jgi:quinone-reactive Ni/Fe-hydrogenase large subunit